MANLPPGLSSLCCHGVAGGLIKLRFLDMRAACGMCCHLSKSGFPQGLPIIILLHKSYGVVLVFGDNEMIPNEILLDCIWDRTYVVNTCIDYCLLMCFQNNSYLI